jgi:putative hydroxymethylpyrimidine transport system substrate-binding protein
LDPTKTRRLLSALGEATAWLKANPAEAWTVFAGYAKELDNVLNKAAWKDTVPLLADDPAALERPRYDTFAAFLVQRGLINRVPPPDAYLRDMRP